MGHCVDSNSGKVGCGSMAIGEVGRGKCFYLRGKGGKNGNSYSRKGVGTLISLGTLGKMPVRTDVTPGGRPFKWEARTEKGRESEHYDGIRTTIRRGGVGGKPNGRRRQRV